MSDMLKHLASAIGKLTAVEVLGFLAPGGLVLYILIQVDRQSTSILPEGWPTTPLDLGIAVLVALILGFLIGEVSHWLKKPYDNWYVERQRRNGDPLLDQARAVKEAAVGPGGSSYAFAQTELRRENPQIYAASAFLEGVSKMFRALSHVLPVLALWLFFGVDQLVLAVVCVLLAPLCVLVFFRLRYQASCVAYQNLIALRAKQSAAAKI